MVRCNQNRIPGANWGMAEDGTTSPLGGDLRVHDIFSSPPISVESNMLVTTRRACHARGPQEREPEPLATHIVLQLVGL